MKFCCKYANLMERKEEVNQCPEVTVAPDSLVIDMSMEHRQDTTPTLRSTPTPDLRPQRLIDGPAKSHSNESCIRQLFYCFTANESFRRRRSKISFHFNFQWNKGLLHAQFSQFSPSNPHVRIRIRYSTEFKWNFIKK